MSTSSNNKDVIYVDVDDEITGIIDKVTSAHAKVVALVLPKRATVFQSIVNMKLLKKRAETAKKHIVLITSETGLMPLAGTVGLYVAATLQSKPEIPAAAPMVSDVADELDEKSVPLSAEDFDTDKEAATPVGRLASASTPSVAKTADDDTLELDNSDLPAGDESKGRVASAAALAAAGGSGKAARGKKDAKLKVPNFNRFRQLAVFGVLALILLIVAGVFAFKVLPKAVITVHTNTSTVNANLSPTLNTNAPSLDLSKNVVPAQIQQQQASSNQQVAATGKQNLGNKATGTVTMTAQACAPNLGNTPSSVPAGTGVSANGLTFITQGTANFTQSGFSNGSCIDYTSGAINITAQTGGAQYNVGDNTAFTVAGRSDVSAAGSTSGGTDNIVTVVQQSDIDSAKSQLKGNQNADSAKQQLEQKLQSDGLYPIEATFNASSPNISSSVQVGTQADNVTVTESITYTMYGAKESDLHTLLDNQIKQQIDASKQSIQTDGMSQSSFSVPNPGSGSTLDISLQTTATIGPDINVANLKQQVAGKKSGDVETLIKALPGVTDVQVHFSPFWVGAAPSNTSKITITLEK